MSVRRNDGRAHVRPAAVTSLRGNRNTSANSWNASVVIATWRPRMRSEGKPGDRRGGRGDGDRGEDRDRQGARRGCPR